MLCIGACRSGGVQLARNFLGIWRPLNLMLWCAPAFMQLFWGMGFERSTTDLANQPPCDTAGAGHTAIFLSCVQRLWRGCSVPLSDVAITCYPGQSPSHASNLFWSDRSGNHIHRFVFAVLVSLRILYWSSRCSFSRDQSGAKAVCQRPVSYGRLRSSFTDSNTQLMRREVR